MDNQTHIFKGLVRKDECMYAIIVDDEGHPYSVACSDIEKTLRRDSRDWGSGRVDNRDYPGYQALSCALRSMTFFATDLPEGAQHSDKMERVLSLPHIDNIVEFPYGSRARISMADADMLLTSAVSCGRVPEDFVAIGGERHGKKRLVVMSEGAPLFVRIDHSAHKNDGVGGQFVGAAKSFGRSHLFLKLADRETPLKVMYAFACG